jgi:rhodanese-related sulfurtransferase
MPELTSPDQEVVLMCSEGYSSALSADLAQQELGLTNVADLEGGFAAWKEAGLPWISHAPDPLRRS